MFSNLAQQKNVMVGSMSLASSIFAIFSNDDHGHVCLRGRASCFVWHAQGLLLRSDIVHAISKLYAVHCIG